MNFKNIKNSAKQILKYNFVSLFAVCFILAFLTSEFSSSLRIVKERQEVININTTYTVAKEKIYQDGPVKYLVDIGIDELTEGNEIFKNSINAIKNFNIMHYETYLPIALIFAIYLLYVIFISNPIIVGSKLFFIQNNHKKSPKIKLTFKLFSSKYYYNVIKVMLLKTIYLFFWTFTIVGLFIKFYEYSLIPYIIAEEPNLSAKKVFAKSKKLMKKHKFELFLFDMSFILWDILGIMTLGLTNILYLNAYKSTAKTIFYETLKKEIS